jgi:hypothetical protein
MDYMKKIDFHTAIILSSSILGSVYLLSTSLDMINEIIIYGNSLDDNVKNKMFIINGTIICISAVSYVYLMNIVTR